MREKEREKRKYTSCLRERARERSKGIAVRGSVIGNPLREKERRPNVQFTQWQRQRQRRRKKHIPTDAGKDAVNEKKGEGR